MRLTSSPQYDLTYDDVFFLPSRSAVGSRFGVDLVSDDGTGTTTPLIAANMTAVSGKRMAETMARRGGLAILPQDLSRERLVEIITAVKQLDPIVEKPLTVRPATTVGQVRALLPKRAHGIAVVVVDGRPVGTAAAPELAGVDAFTAISEVMVTDPHTVALADTRSDLGDLSMMLSDTRDGAGVVLDDEGRLVGVLTAKGALRSTLYAPALDARGRLRVGVALGINGDVGGTARALVEAGADVLVLDTAHGHQDRMLDALAELRAAIGHPDGVVVCAGNVVTADGTTDLLAAGADVVKVGVGPGAMCTTRMQTGVGRPQLSAVLDCAAAARARGGRIWADGGVRHPRDVALALAAGASNVMVGSWFAGTYESPGDLHHDAEGRAYKENFGMASKRAVSHRTAGEDTIARARKALFEEGISSSTMYLEPGREGVEDLIDQITAGVRSSCTYVGAQDLAAFRERAVVGIQSASGFAEGRPIASSWS